MKSAIRILTALLIFTCSSVYADVYIGAGGYVTVLNGKISSHDVDDKDFAPAFFLGWRPIELVGVEVGYYDFGEFKGDNGESLKGNATTLVGLLSLELGPVGAYAKAGVADYSFDVKHPTSNYCESKTDPLAGVGLTVDLMDKLYVYAEYIRFDSDIDVDVAGAGLRYSF